QALNHGTEVKPAATASATRNELTQNSVHRVLVREIAIIGTPSGTAKLNTLRHRRRLRVNTTKRTRHMVARNANSNRAMQAARETERARISHKASSVKQATTKAVAAINDLNNARPQAGTVP